MVSENDEDYEELKKIDGLFEKILNDLEEPPKILFQLSNGEILEVPYNR